MEVFKRKSADVESLCVLTQFSNFKREGFSPSRSKKIQRIIICTFNLTSFQNQYSLFIRSPYPEFWTQNITLVTKCSKLLCLVRPILANFFLAKRPDEERKCLSKSSHTNQSVTQKTQRFSLLRK